MRQLFSAILLFILCGGIFYSCKKYKDPAPNPDPRLTNPYCNDPRAVNYNWGFPGKPDNTTCIYPRDLFKQHYFFYDTVRVISSGLFISADSFVISFSPRQDTNYAKIAVTGAFCGAGTSFTLLMTADATYSASSDTTAGDSTTAHVGQIFCHPYDTVAGTITRDRISDSLLLINLTVYSDTAIYSHQGRAFKIK